MENHLLFLTILIAPGILAVALSLIAAHFARHGEATPLYLERIH
jgi:hypothetical protein